MFEESGFSVHVATTAEEAERLTATLLPDAVLLDLGLPDRDGLTILDTWRARGEPIPHVYALTGSDDEETRRRAMAGGCREVILKPARAMELVRRIKSAVEGPG